MNDETLTIQQMAARSGLSVHTLRYYERIGLLDPVERAENGHRRYAPADIERVGFLYRLRATGMSIRTMQQYTAHARSGEMSVELRRELLEAHREVLQAQIAELQEHLAVIDAKIGRYQQRGRSENEAMREQPCIPTSRKGSEQ
jgi:DNA-binding transcriptional MerR regulator